MRWGIVLSALWLIEIITGNFGTMNLWSVHLLYYGTTETAFVLPLFGGFLGARQTGRTTTGTLIGLWGGCINGLCACLALSIIGLWLNVPIQHNPQTIQEFMRSGTADIRVFIVGDFLVGGLNHFWLVGPVLGMLTGIIGGLIGAQFAQPQPQNTFEQ